MPLRINAIYLRMQHYLPDKTLLLRLKLQEKKTIKMHKIVHFTQPFML